MEKNVKRNSGFTIVFIFVIASGIGIHKYVILLPIEEETTIKTSY